MSIRWRLAAKFLGGSARALLGGTQGRAVFESQCCQRGVSHERPRDLGFAYLVLQKLPESLTCSYHVDIGQL